MTAVLGVQIEQLLAATNRLLWVVSLVGTALGIGNAICFDGNQLAFIWTTDVSRFIISSSAATVELILWHSKWK